MSEDFRGVILNEVTVIIENEKNWIQYELP
jgi:hypothetical protein